MIDFKGKREKETKIQSNQVCEKEHVNEMNFVKTATA